MVAIESTPPLVDQYNQTLHDQSRKPAHDYGKLQSDDRCDQEQPIIDLAGLMGTDEIARTKCASEIVAASSEWGFFKVVNHGISTTLLSRMRREQMDLFNASFSRKSTCGLLNNSYRWGNPSGAAADSFSWSEAFHIPLTKISDQSCYGEFSSLREVMVEYASAMQKLAKLLSEVLIMNLGQKIQDFEEMISCDENTCFLRLNRYPKCPLSQEIYGLLPHTDSDFLTILHQVEVGGLQLIKDSKWVDVNPLKEALIVNIGDLFQAWSNDLYKSVVHKVVTNPKMERFSLAYFVCPSYDSLITSCEQPAVYNNFTFAEYRAKVQEDALLLGQKIGLSRFLRS